MILLSFGFTPPQVISASPWLYICLQTYCSQVDAAPTARLWAPASSLLGVYTTSELSMSNHTPGLVQFSRSVVSDSLRSHGLQHTRPPCPSPTPGVHSDSCPIESVLPSNHLILCRPLLLLPSIFPSVRVFSSESILHMRWSKYWSFSFSISPFHEYSGLISFRMDWLDLLAVQGTLKSLLQHHSSKASILRHSAFFTVQLSKPESSPIILNKPPPT